MKKLLALILTAALTLSLVACGGGGTGDTNTPSGGNGGATSTDTPNGGGEDSTSSVTKEELLDQATKCSAATINNDTLDNVARAKQTYCGKTLLIKGQITEIGADHITMGAGNTNIEVYLQTEDIVNLEYKQFVTIVGNVGEEITEGTLAPGIPQKVYIYEVRSAYFVTDKYEYTGTPKSENDSFPGAWNVEFPGNPYLKLVYFDESIDVSQYERKEITFSAKNVDDKYYDAVITETPPEEPIENRIKTFSHDDRNFFKEYVQDMEPMSADVIQAILTDTTFSMRNNYGGDGDGTHTITFRADGTLDATYISKGEERVMYVSWRMEDNLVICVSETDERTFTPYQFDETRYLLIDTKGDYSMVLTQQ